MVEVATSMNLPNKLSLPALIKANARGSLLGLGDIIVPGLYLNFLFKLDKKLNDIGESYFHAGIIAYAISFL